MELLKGARGALLLATLSLFTFSLISARVAVAPFVTSVSASSYRDGAGPYSARDVLPFWWTGELESISTTCTTTSSPTIFLPTTSSLTGGNENGDGNVFIDPQIWESHLPIVTCAPPCNVILPPYVLSENTTITFPPYTATITESLPAATPSSVVVVTFAPVTTSIIPVYNLNVTDSAIQSATFSVTPSMFPAPMTITLGLLPRATAENLPSNAIVVSSTPDLQNPPWPLTVAGKPSLVSQTSGGLPGPTCLDKCGIICDRFCQILCPRSSSCPPLPVFTTPVSTSSTLLPASTTPLSTSSSLLPTSTSTLSTSTSVASSSSLPASAGNPVIIPIPIGIPPFELPPGWLPPEDGPVSPPGGDAPSPSTPATVDPPAPTSTNNPDDPDKDADDCSVSVDPPSSMTGLCSNGNYPIWDDETGDIDCDTPTSAAADLRTECQIAAESEVGETDTAIECRQDVCDTSSVQKRAPPKCKPDVYTDGEEGKCLATFLCDTDRWPNVCNNARSAMDKKGAASILTWKGKGKHAVARYGALHAIIVPAPVVSTLNGKKSPGGRSDGKSSNNLRDAGGFKPVTGWGLIGCQIEEYPFGNSIDEDDEPIAEYNERPTLRLISQGENGNHGGHMSSFLAYLKNQFPAETKAGKLTYCVKVTGNNKPDDYCLNANAVCNNKCAAAYGPAFTLVNEITEKDAEAAEKAKILNGQQWDQWFDEKDSSGATPRKYPHTLSWEPAELANGHTVPVVSDLPPRFNRWPSPGLKIYTGDFPNGNWVLSYTVTTGNKNNIGKVVTVGTPDLERVYDPRGTHLMWDGPPNTVNGDFPVRRSVGNDSWICAEGFLVSNFTMDGRRVYTYELNTTSLASYESSANSTMVARAIDHMSPPQEVPHVRSNNLTARQLTGGSWLDPTVYLNALYCPLASGPNGDDTPCEDCGYLNFQPGQGTKVSYTVTGTSITDTGLTGTVAPLPPPSPDPSPSTDPPGAPTPTPEPTYNCKGSGSCGTQPNMLADCDHAVNVLQRDDIPKYGSEASDAILKGNCWASHFLGICSEIGCGVLVQGPAHCKFSGNQIWWDYQDLRDPKKGDCGICGSKVYSDGCEVTVNFVSHGSVPC